MIVVDASAALAWCLSDEADEYAERMLERVVAESAAAPAHFGRTRWQTETGTVFGEDGNPSWPQMAAELIDSITLD